MHASPENSRPCFAKPGEAPAKPTRSLRGPISCHHPLASASEAQTSPSFLPRAETWYLALATQEPSRKQFAKAKVFREAARSQPLHKSKPWVAIREAPPSVYRPLNQKNTAHLTNCLFDCLSVYLSACLFFYLSICLFALCVCLAVNPSSFLSIGPSVCPSI